MQYTAANDPLQNYSMEAVNAGEVRDFGSIYWQMGAVSSGPPISFVARPAFFATGTSDTTLMVLAVSLPNRGLTFERDGPMFRAEYTVALSLRRNNRDVWRDTAFDTVRVATLKETRRTDESLVFKQVVRVPPGRYLLSLSVCDVGGAHEAVKEGMADIPRLGNVSLSRPVVVYDGIPRLGLDDVPQLLPAPRASAVFGADASIPVYMEAYGAGLTTPVAVHLENSAGHTVWSDTAWLAQRKELASGIVNIPLQQADAGIFTIVASHKGIHGTDTTRTPIFIGFGPDLPVISFEEMVGYLRYFTSPDKVRMLKNADPAHRGEVWAAFLRETDPIPETPQNEALQAYFLRIRDANVLYQVDGPQGWLSDRGEVYVALGEPDQTYEQEGRSNSITVMTAMSSRTRFLTWEYRDLQSSITFYDETGGGQWRMLPSSASEFRTLVARRTRQYTSQ